MKMIWESFCCHFRQIVSPRCNIYHTSLSIHFRYSYFFDAANLKPIALPLKNVMVPRPNEEGSVSAFGIVEDIAKPAPNEDMKTTFLTVVKDADCPIKDFATQAASNFCARDMFFNTRLCRGDVGSAFVVLQRGIPTLVRSILFNEKSKYTSKWLFHMFCFRPESRRK